MKFNVLNLKILTRCVLPSIALIGFSQAITSYAAPSVTPVYLGKNSAYIDSDVPPAIKLNQDYDGLKEGTYLYRTQYKNMTYYTPVTPAEYRNTAYEPAINKDNYRDWGPWNMGANQVALSSVRSSKKYYKKVTIKAGTSVEGPKPSSPDTGVEIGTFWSAISVDVRARTTLKSGEWIYFSLKGTPLEGANKENIGRVEFGRISTEEIPTDIFRSGTSTATNFSYLGNYKDTTDSSHVNLVKGEWKNASNAPDGLANEYGEWGCLGYSAKGEPLSNPYFPSWSLHFLGCSEIKYYDWRSNPFSEKSAFDGDAYLSARKELVERLIDEGVLTYTGNKQTAITNWTNKFTFLTHPTKDIAILRGKRTATDATRKFTAVNPPGDLYLANLDVYDGNTKVASYSHNIKTGAKTRSNGNNIVKGRKYTVKVQIGNAKNRKVLASKNQATIGITKESAYLNLSTLTSTKLSGASSKESGSNTIGSAIGNKSDVITFSVTAPTDSDVFDIYALVGDNHDGTDNLDYTNDAGFVRMYTKDAFREGSITVDKANLKAMSVELLDTSNNDAVVYSSSGNTVNTAIIPGKSYKIRYTMKNIGGRPTVTTYTAGYESSDGTWHPGTSTTSYPTVEVPISYTNTLKVHNNSGNIADVSASGSNKKVSVNGSTNISLQAGSTYTYTTEALYFANPYLKSSFTINATGMANSDTTDDTASTTINDLYDAVISDVKIYPVYEYVSSGERNAIFNVTYKAKIDTATHIKNVGNISSKVNTLITVGDRTLPFKDVLIANNEWQEFSHTLEKVTLKNDTTGVKAVVTLNYDRKTHETNFDNNTGQSSSNVVKVVANPFDGSNSDKVSRIDTSNGASLNGGGVLNNNCLIPRRSNSWTMSHRKHSWTQANKSYTINGSSYSSEVYTTSSQSTVSKSYTESFKIKKVEFKSKETEGKGTDGWINLLSTDPAILELAKVKAGYGFELRLVTEYRTDATRTQPIGNSTTKYTGIIGDNDPGHAWNKGINYSDELFVELPGTEGVHGTRKILSTTGYAGTTNGLVISERDLSTSSEVVKEFTYTIKPSNTLGINQVGKIFIPTGLKDGKYKISIYTPPISGAISDGKNKYTSLCDRRDVYINVSGSYTDDLNSNIIQ